MPAGIKNKFTWLLAGLALLVGILYVAPELLIWKNLHDAGKPFVVIQLTHHADEAYGTISRFREIYDGHFPPGDLYLSASNAPTPFGPLQVMPLLMAGFIYLFAGNINASYLFATFILSGVVFLIFYWLIKVLTGDRVWSIFGAFFGVMTPAFKVFPMAFESLNLFLNNILKFFIPLVGTPLEKLPLSRTEDPLLTYLLFLPAIGALLLFWRKPNWKTGVLFGALTGGMFYVYFHYWVFLVIIAGLIGFYALWNFKKDQAFFKSVLGLWAAILVVTIPYWANYLAFKHSPTAADVTARIGVETSRAPLFIAGVPSAFDYVFYLALAAIIYFVFYKRGDTKTAALYWLCTAAMPIVWNVQLVTGFVPDPDHWFRPIGAFVFIILFHSVYEILKSKNHKKVAAVLIIGAALIIAKKVANAGVFINPPADFTAENTQNSYTFDPGIVESWNWINENLPHEPKIISPSFITSLYLNVQTSARPYFAGGFNTAASNAELEERFLNTYKLFSVSPAFLEGVVRVNYQDMVCNDLSCPNSDPITRLNTKETIAHLYVGYYINEPGRPKSEGQYRFISKEKADELIARYAKLSANWKAVDADYVYYGPWERQIVKTDLSKDASLERVYKNQDVEIYKIRR